MDQGQPDAIHPFIIQLNEALMLESKFQPHLQLPSVTQDLSEITSGIRDGSAHVLRCLKVWYDLPSDVLFVAISLMDRFLTKMKARPKHMACISVSCFHLAAKQVHQYQKGQGMEDVVPVPDARDLVVISQCKCTLGDLARMEGIISSKLDAEPGVVPVTSLTFLRLFTSLFAAASEQLGVGVLFKKVVTDPSLWLKLEILACDSACANFRPSEVALVLLCTQLDKVADFSTRQDPSVGAELMQLINFAIELQKTCKIPENTFFCCHEVVMSILARYNAQCQMPHRQRLVWKLSQRTLRYLRPTDKLTSILPTINEHGQLQLPARVRSGSVSSDESCDSEKEDVAAAEWSPSLNPVDWARGAMNTLPEEDEVSSKECSATFLHKMVA